MKKLVIISGPTAVGKTEISIDLARKINGEIISADSVQVYKHMDIGSAKIKDYEMMGIKHHLIDILEPYEEFNVVKFQQLAKKAINDCYKKNKIPIIVGGTGFYIQSVLYDIDFAQEEKNNKLRDALYYLYDKYGADFFYELVKNIDEKSAFNIHKNNKKRIVRALEYYIINNSKISEHNEEQMMKKSEYDFSYFVLNMDRKSLYSRIDQRVEKMFEAGLLDEFDELLKYGVEKNMTSMQGIGYKEIFEYKEGIINKEELIDKIKKSTRHFAKRQLTWFRREEDVCFIDVDKHSKEEILNFMIDKIAL